MERSGMTFEQVAEEARCSRQTVSRLFSGDNLPRFHLFTSLLPVLDVAGEDRARALELWEIANAGTVNVEHANNLPPPYMRFRMDEQEADRERTLDPVIVPGLLQTSAYAEAISLAYRERWKGDWDAATGTAERRDRQALLTRAEQPLVLHALIDEVTLHRVVGGRTVMAEQLDHLIEMSRRPNITIQVVPFLAGAYGAMAGVLSLLSFPEEDEPDAAYMESLLGISTVENRDDVTALSAVWDGVAAVALSATKSVNAIRAAKGKGR
jgi:transcriptional regulator with XRE-family HTH domain